MGYRQDLIVLTEYYTPDRIKIIRVNFPNHQYNLHPSENLQFPVEFIPTLKRYPEITLRIGNIHGNIHHFLMDYAANHEGMFPLADIFIEREIYETIQVLESSILETTENTLSVLGILRAEEILNKIGYRYELEIDKNRSLEDVLRKELAQPFLRRFRNLLEE